SSTKAFAESGGHASVGVSSTTATLDDILDRYSLRNIDFLTMDVELAEPRALNGFSIQRFRPRLVCVEAHPQVRHQILAYFARSGYVVAAKYLRADVNNLWFVPMPEGTVPANRAH